MTPLGIFKRRKKETEGKIEKKIEEKTLLEELCKGDNELYSALSRTLLLNPETTKKSGEMDARVEKAQEYEKNKDYLRARITYQVAAELALFEGKAAQVQKLFKKAAEIDPAYLNRSIFEFLAKKENAEKAIAVAQEYYARMAKPTP
jgi:hypothetical protein